MKYCYLNLIFLVFTCPAYAQSILQLGLANPETGTLLDLQIPAEHNIDYFPGRNWLADHGCSLKCHYQSIVVEDLTLSGNNSGTQQGDFITRYYFSGEGATATYLGIEAGWRRTDFGSVRESGLVFGSRLGIRYFFNNAVSIDTSISYKFSTGDVFIVDSDMTDNYLYPGIGLRAMFY